MMEPALLILGLFLLVAIVKNKELSDNDDNEAVFTFLSISVIFLIFGGIGFLLPSAKSTFPNFSFLIPIYVFMAAIATATRGRRAVIATVALIAVFTFIIMGSFM